MKKSYYYYVQVSPAINRGALYFKAKNKKQIRHYMQLKHIEAHSQVFDPTLTPVDGIVYIDVSDLKPPAATVTA